MVWFRVDDGWHDHPKVVGLSLAAAGLWSKAGCWCSEHLTDGAITWPAVRSLGGTRKLAGELVTAKLWETAQDGWQFHEWFDHQPSRADVLAERERKSKAGSAGAQARWHPPSGSNGRPHNGRMSLPSEVPCSRPDPVPSRPEPERKDSDARARGTGFQPTTPEPRTMSPLTAAQRRDLASAMRGEKS